jgi:hypothetical protein
MGIFVWFFGEGIGVSKLRHLFELETQTFI